MIPHTFRVWFEKHGAPAEYLDFTGHNRRARARGFAMIKRADGYETRIQPIGF